MSELMIRLSRVVQVVFDGDATAAAHAASTLPSTLHRILEGKVEAPRISTVAKMADGFGLPFAWLIGEVSTADAQAKEPVRLWEPYWLISRFHRRTQQFNRSWLARVKEDRNNGYNREAIKIIADYTDFGLIPNGSGDAVLDLYIKPLINLPAPGTAVEIALYRRLAEVETEMVALAVKRLRRIGVRIITDEQGSNGRK